MRAEVAGMNTHAVTSDELWGPLDKMKQAAERNRHNGSDAGPVTTADSPQAMDVDPNSPTGATAPNSWDPHLIAAAAAAAAPAGSDDVITGQDQDPLLSSGSDQADGAHASKKAKVTDPPSTDVVLKLIGADDSNPERLDARAPPAAASLRYQVTDEGTVTLPPAGAAIEDADDQQEDDLLGMQPEDYEYDDDVAAVSGDILGVGPTWGTVAGDPTSSLGGLGLAKHFQDSLGQAEGDQAAPLVTPGSEVRGGTAGDTSRGAGPQVTKIETLAGTSGDSAAGTLSEGDADVRGRLVTAGVREDADLPLRDAAAGMAGLGGGEEGSEEGGMGVDAAGADAVGVDDDDDEYPEGFDGLDPGAIAHGEFKPLGPHIRHRSAGDAGVDPDPRNRKTPDPSRGLRDIGSLKGLGDVEVQGDVKKELGVGGGGNHPVEKGDFAMGTLAVPTMADGDATGVRALEYTDEPKYAPEVEIGDLEGPREGLADNAVAKDANQSSALGCADDRSVAVNGVAAKTAADVGHAARGPTVEDSGPILLQQVGIEGVQQRSIADVPGAQPGADGSDAEHLNAIFGQRVSSSDQ